MKIGNYKRYVVLALIILLALAFAKEAVRLWKGEDTHGHVHIPGESHTRHK